MTIQDHLKADPLPWLLEEESPGARYLALRDIVGLSEDDTELIAARKTAHKNGPIAATLAEMDIKGFWVKPGPGYIQRYRSSVWSIIMLAQLGARIDEDERIKQACNYLLDHALTSNGQFTMTGAPSGTIDCLQGNLCWSMIELGCDDPRLELAFDWMARSVTGEGIAPLENQQAPVRYYAGKCGPNFACGYNNKFPCAWGAAKVMLALGKWPNKLQTPLIKDAIQEGIDFLFSTDPAKAEYPRRHSKNKPSPNWWKFGFPVFYITDLLQIVEGLVSLGYGNDPRLANAISIIREKQDKDGRWPLEYDYSGKTWTNFGEKDLPNKWVTLRALRVLKAIDAN